jgi:hypothetical protein
MTQSQVYLDGSLDPAITLKISDRATPGMQGLLALLLVTLAVMGTYELSF